MDTVARVVGRIARRLGACALIRAVGRSLCVATAVAMVVVLAERLLSLGVSTATAIGVPLAVGTMFGVALGLARWPGRTTSALRADARLGLDERLSSALAAGDGPMAELLHADATRCAAAIKLRESFPVELGLSAQALPLLAALLVVAVLVPELDLLGRGRARTARAAQAAAAGAAVAEAQAALDSLRDRARERGLGGAAMALDDAARALAATAPGSGAAETAREADRIKGALDARREANGRALGAASSEEQKERLLRQRDLLANAARAVERLRGRLAGGGGGPAGPPERRPTTAKDSGKEPVGGQPLFARPQETPPSPHEAAALARRLVAARDAAAEAMSHARIPWRYRGVVRRYFSPDERLPRRGDG